MPHKAWLCMSAIRVANFLFFSLTSLRAFLEGKDKGTRNKEPALRSKCHKINARHDNTLINCNEALLLLTANRRGGAHLLPQTHKAGEVQHSQDPRENAMPGQCSSAHDRLPLKRAVGSMAPPTNVSAAEGASNQRVQAADTRRQEQRRPNRQGEREDHLCCFIW